jgi:sulfatase maturation enzyme AslB (radical SAM superfamily)
MDDASPSLEAPPGFHLLAKPTGSTCNIDCTYCFFLSKAALYPNDKQRMSEATLDAYIRQLLEAHRTPHVTVAWQGGEPTLMKLEFFRRAVELFFTHTRPAMQHMARLLQQRRPPSDVMAIVAEEDERQGAYRPCPCGGGEKFRFCHGDRGRR